MKRLLRNLPVRHKLSAIVMVTAATVLVIFYAFFIANFWFSSRGQLVSSVHTLTKAVSINATAALVFDDELTANELLNTLSANKDIEYAVLRNIKGVMFAEYGKMNTQALRTDSQQYLELLKTQDVTEWQHKFYDDHLELEQLIKEKDRVIGSLGIWVSLASYKEMVNNWMMFGLLVLSVVLCIGYFISSRLQAVIINPIEKLIHTMRVVAEVNDYSRRVENTSADEFGVMVDGFNTMIGQIQERDEALKSARDTAEEANLAKSRFLATMSHEIRTPMNGVLGMAELLLSSPLSVEQKRQVDTIHRSGAALLNIINDILDYSKIEAGQLKLESIQFDLYQQIEEVLLLLSETGNGKTLVVSHQFDPDFNGQLLGDPVRVRQILLNLIGNALKFTHVGYVSVEVTLLISAASPCVRIDVHDSGPGISEDVLEKIFESFSQADSSTTRQYGGTGLGLAISQQLVELMQGRIGVESRLGKGSVFWFELPIGLQNIDVVDHGKVLFDSAFSPIEQSDMALSVFQGHILLVEDNAVNQQVAIGLLGMMGCSVDMAANGAEAIDIWRNNPYDLILMDIEMPVMDGIAAMSAIREKEIIQQLPYTPIVAVTANAMDGDRELYLSRGMDDYLSKPYSRQSLHKMLAHWLKEQLPTQPSDMELLQEKNMDPDLCDLNMQQLNSFHDLKDENGSPLIEALITTYIENSNQIIRDLDLALLQNDFEEVRRLAHALKSSSGTLGLDRVNLISGKMEHGCRLSHSGNMPAYYQLLVKANQSAQQKLVDLM